MDTLYHYCSTKTFHSIVENRSIWLSSLSLSNDSMEGKLVSEVITMLAKEDGLDGATIERLQDTIGNLENFLDGLGFCLSEDGDLLSQWRGYADNAEGVSIGFSKAYLEELKTAYSGKKISGFNLSKVQYDEADQRKLLEPAFKEMKKLIADGALKPHGFKTLLTMGSDKEIKAENERINKLFRSLSLTVLTLFGELFVLKSHAFREEIEWRLISIFLKNGEDDAQYRCLSDRIIPYREYELPPLDNKVITEVILGPRNNTPHHVCKGLLSSKGFTDVQIKNSEATYRG